MTAAILSYALSHLQEGTGKLRKTCADTVSHLSESRCAARGLSITHPSTEPAQSCLIWVIAWHRTPNTHRTLSVINMKYITLKEKTDVIVKILMTTYEEL